RTMDVYGWLAPSGNFLKTEMYAHAAAIGEHAELKALIPDYDSEIASLNDIRESCEERIEKDEHPEWHCYEMASSDVNYKIVCALKEAGCLRVGSTGNRMYFEGTGE